MNQKNLLCISNGHGEDVIATRILNALRQQSPHISLAALPISGAGSAYRKANIDIIGPTQTLPSGGFLNQDPKQLARDVKGGLISLTRAQLAAMKKWCTQLRQTSQIPHILAVGDIVPLIFAHRTGVPYHFIGTAKSEYWLHNNQDNESRAVDKRRFSKLKEGLRGWSGSVYLPWERWLMQQPNCQSLFVRDSLTAQRLKHLGIPAQYEGNPMMDGLAPTGALEPILNPLRSQAQTITIALLPGSRAPEAYENWARLLRSIPSLTTALPDRLVVLLGAIAPALSLEKLPFPLALDNHPWAQVALPSLPSSLHCFAYSSQNITLIPIQGAYNDCLHEADIAIATAGTATEQFVGLGKPALTLPGPGPQFTPSFAQTQAKMLGPSIEILNSPEETGDAITKLTTDLERLAAIRTNGRQRMGDPGASQRIAKRLVDAMNNEIAQR